MSFGAGVEATNTAPRPFPGYYNPSGVALRKGVTGFGPGDPFNRTNIYDIYKWDIVS